MPKPHDFELREKKVNQFQRKKKLMQKNILSSFNHTTLNILWVEANIQYPSLHLWRL